MNVSELLSSFALRQVVGEGAEIVVRSVVGYFSDHSQTLVRALERSNDRAWRSLEISLAGEGLLEWFASADDQALRTQMKQFVAQTRLPSQITSQPKLRNLILAELRDARNKGFLRGDLRGEAITQQAATFSRYADATKTIAAERGLLLGMAGHLKRAGYENLAWLLEQPANAHESIVVVAATFYFRREVERDEKLAHTLQLSALEGISAQQAQAFAAIDEALSSNQQRIEAALSALHREILSAVQEMRQRLSGEMEELKQLQAQVLALVQKLEMKHQPVHAGHSLMLQNDRERTLVKQFLARFRALPAQQQATHSELLNDLGKLQVAAGDFAGASKTFLDVADVAPSDRAKAEAHHNAYHAALEQADFQLASTEWSRAIALDPARFAPFPLDKYEALRILGAGGFGVTFLCRHKISKGQVAVKALFADELARDIQTVMEEATTLDHLKHRAIVGLRDCGFADVAQTRPYLVMAYFNGMTLEEHVKTKGTLPIEDVLPIAETMAEALEAAHGARVLHRDIKPANVLIRKDGDTWEICLIDFGLAVKQGRLDSATGSFNQGKSLLRESAVGTLGYAAPEQLGRIPGAVVGPRADIYGFGKTLAYALFGMAEPGLQHYRKLPEKFAELLSDCINQAPEERPANFAEVRKRLRKEKAKSPKTTAIMDVVAVDLEEEPDQRPIRKKRREDAEPRQTVDIDLGTRILHGALAFFLGWTGIHKFMQDNTGAGITRLALSCTGVGLYLTLPAGIIEAVMYLARGNEDYHERYIRKKQWWF